MDHKLINAPSSQKAQYLLDMLVPGSTLTAILPLAGSYTNLTHMLEAVDAEGKQQRLVIRSYVYGDPVIKARVEYNALCHLQKYNVPAPSPLYLDEEGIFLVGPGIVISNVDGELIEDPSQHPSGGLVWAGEMARTLAQIHSVDCAPIHDLLLDANAEATWFLSGGKIPEYMRDHPDGVRVWHSIHDYMDKLEPVPKSLVHIDYWRGNVLWANGTISAVIDWEEAAYGDPAIDVGYCVMELAIMGMMEEATEFLRIYQSIQGQVKNLYFWALAATARPMYDIQGWITDSYKDARFRQFIASSLNWLISSSH